MSRYSVPDKALDGAWGDIMWRKSHGRYLVYVGERIVGEVWRMQLGWFAVSYAQGEALLGLRGVHGFVSRWAATEYILDVGVRPKRED